MTPEGAIWHDEERTAVLQETSLGIVKYGL